MVDTLKPFDTETQLRILRAVAILYGIHLPAPRDWRNQLGNDNLWPPSPTGDDDK